MSNIKSLDKLREVVRCGKAHAFSSSKAYYDTLGGCIAEIEREVAELQESWAQEAREHANDSARLAELAHENAELEREISERFVELPVDADGIPIRVGDLIEFGRKGERLEVTHIGWTKHGDPTIAYRRPNGTLDCSCIGSGCWHVKPRTLEDVLREFGMECADDAYATDWAVAIYADEIRELMGVGE